MSDAGPNAARAGRKFSFTVGTAFVVLAGVATWRDHPTLAMVLAALGGALLLGGLVVPARMRAVERVWMQFALLLSKVTTPIFMGVVYFLIIAPTGFLRRTLARSPMRPVATKDSFWVASVPMSRDRLRQQY